MCIEFLLTAQMLYAIASEHNADNRYISEAMEVSRAGHYMVAYRRCIKESR